MLTLQQSLGNAAAIRGISIDDPTRTLQMLLKQHEVSSIYHSLATARGNATHVGTVELIRAMSEAVLTLEDDSTMPETPLDALLLTNQLLERLSAVYKVIDDSWFHQGSVVRGRGLSPLRTAVKRHHGRKYEKAGTARFRPSLALPDLRST